MAKFINITPPEFACSDAMTCPAVYRSEDGKSIRVRGRLVSRDGSGSYDLEKVVEVPADLLEASLGVKELVEALRLFEDVEDHCDKDFSDDTPLGHILSGDRITLGDIRRARAALSKYGEGKMSRGKIVHQNSEEPIDLERLARDGGRS